MSKFQVIALVSLGIIAGTIFGTSGIKAIREKVSGGDANSKVDQIRELSGGTDENFIDNYYKMKDSLTEGEKILGDRLYSCLQDNQSFENELAEYKGASEDENKEKKKSFIERFLGDDAPKSATSNIPQGNLLPYARGGRNVAPLEVVGSRYLELFANAKFQNPDEENFGIEQGVVDDVNDFLKKKVCLEPAFSVITQDRKDQSKFFDSVKSGYFRGNTMIYASNPKDPAHKFKTQVQFNSPVHDGFDYIEIKSDKDTMEQRVINPEITNEAWRYNTCQPSVVLLSDRCPWNDKFVYEFKDFYYVPDSKKMIGNVYCKNVAESRWTQMGTFELDQSADNQ